MEQNILEQLRIPMKFIFKADAALEAEDINDALAKIALHYSRLAYDAESSLFTSGYAEITPYEQKGRISPASVLR